MPSVSDIAHEDDVKIAVELIWMAENEGGKEGFAQAMEAYYEWRNRIPSGNSHIKYINSLFLHARYAIQSYMDTQRIENPRAETQGVERRDDI